MHTTSIIWGDDGGQKVQGLRGARGYFRVWIVGESGLCRAVLSAAALQAHSV